MNYIRRAVMCIIQSRNFCIFSDFQSNVRFRGREKGKAKIIVFSRETCCWTGQVLASVRNQRVYFTKILLRNLHLVGERGREPADLWCTSKAQLDLLNNSD